FFFSSRRRHTRFSRDWSSDVCSSDLEAWVLAGRALSVEEELMDACVWIERLLIRTQCRNHEATAGVATYAAQLVFNVSQEPFQKIGRASCRERVYIAGGLQVVREGER